MRILNGRTKGDSLGRPTFHGRDGTSVVLYATKIFFKMLNILLSNHQHTCLITVKTLNGLMFRKQ